MGPPPPPPPGRWHRARGWGARRPVQLIGAGLIGAIIGGAAVGVFGAVTGGDEHDHAFRYGRPGPGWFQNGPYGPYGFQGRRPFMPCFKMPGLQAPGNGYQQYSPGPNNGGGPMIRCRMRPGVPQQPGQATPSPVPPGAPTLVPAPAPTPSGS